MYKIQPVIDHIEKVYELELTPCSYQGVSFNILKDIFICLFMIR